ncbi:Indoleamine 2,3-dioxygenase [Cryphonectria parasitica EP155]|uniref:Indoleamine 2,3-dioxygenase n=1 Tax=Cryphonectria parasitica (strain ATCC 38755 / EP155) TaxID=660469 RepID=A0A9P5CPB0_CRYP1|nr:Indoleamine 2,3-dioxygenase [Cryphonectria parasitica EP155]KAF3765212.1 Indoleamine 2,3-dioxygenase [Cryphonectria parasitica EP155]
MSPHAVPQQNGYDELLSSFNVTRNGFLPAEEPLARIANPYYEPWELLIHNLTSLLSNGTLRQRVERLPILSTEKLRTEAEWRRAYVILTLLTHGYIWGGEKAAEVLPPPITVPLLSVSSHLEVPPVATYAALNLWNFSSSTGDFTDIDSLHSPHTFTGTRDESWFLCVSVAMEAQGARVIPLMLKAINAIPSRHLATITAALEQLASSIKKVGALLDRMREQCDPMVFYHRIRPFLAGSKNMSGAGLPRGVFYDEGDGRGSWQQWRGGSNGQSSLIQFWDVVLGVTHTSEGSNNPHAQVGKPEEKSFHEEVREYMPGGHRRLLEHVGRCGSIRALAMLPTSGPDHARMQEAYTVAVGTLTEFRNKHLGIITSYIVIPSRKPWSDQPDDKRAAVNLATASSRQQSEKKGAGKESADKELTGTGGTALLPFLKQSRDETSEAGKMVRERMAQAGR